METLDWTKLALDVVPDNSRVPYEPNKHLFVKVAFDVFQLKSSPVESLWILEEGDDGKQYLAAQYMDEQGVDTLESRGNWKALADREKKNITLAYKDTPIQRFASSEYGFTPSDIHIFQRTLIGKLNTDKSFADKLIKSQSEAKRNMLLQQFPELA